MNNNYLNNCNQGYGMQNNMAMGPMGSSGDFNNCQQNFNDQTDYSADGLRSDFSLDDLTFDPAYIMDNAGTDELTVTHSHISSIFNDQSINNNQPTKKNCSSMMSTQMIFCLSWNPHQIFQHRHHQVQECQPEAKAKPKRTIISTIQVVWKKDNQGVIESWVFNPFFFHFSGSNSNESNNPNSNLTDDDDLLSLIEYD